MDIRSGQSWPSKALSNFTPHPFVLDGVEIASMEGFLQSLKFKNPEMQKEVCKLVGLKAKKKGSGKNWQIKQELWWLWERYPRSSDKYQQLLDYAYMNLAEQSKSFRRALLATGNAEITHSIGKRNKNETILTRQEFCSRLMKIRKFLQN